MIELKLVYNIEDVVNYLINLGWLITEVDSSESDEESYTVLIAYKEGFYPTILNRNSLITQCSVSSVFQRIISQKLLEL